MNAFTRDAQVEVPILCGAMYPCSNWELVAAVSRAGALGVIQPLTLQFVFGMDLREAIRKILVATGGKPVAMNVIVEKSSARYEARAQEWVRVGLEEGIKFFVTALGNPRWVCDAVHAQGGVVYHDVTERRFAEKALAEGARGLIAVNGRAGGHAGRKSPEELLEELKPLGVPVVCAGGVGDAETYARMIQLGYAAVQMGTRFIATPECSAHDSYKQAILKAEESDIVLTNRVTGVPLSVIATPHVLKIGTQTGPLFRWLLKHPRTKHLTRGLFALRSLFSLRRSARKGLSTKDFWQAGKSVAGIDRIEPAAEIVKRFASAAK